MSMSQTYPVVTETEVPVKDISAILFRQRWAVLLVLALALLAAGAVCLLMEPVYQSNSRVLLDGRTQPFPVGSNDPINALAPPAFAEDIPTQMEVMQSDRVVYDTLTALNIPIPPPDPNVVPDPNIKVQQVGFTGAVEIQVQSKNSGNAKLIADKLPEIFNTYMRSKSLDVIDRALAFLDNKTATQREAVKKAEEALSDFKVKNQIAGTDWDINTTIGDKSIAQREVAQAVADLEAAKQYYAQLVSYRNQHVQEYIDTVNTNTNQEERLTVQNQIRQANADLAGLRAQYTDEHPLVQQQLKRVKDLESSLKALPANLTNNNKTRNPEYQVFEEKIGDAQAKVDASQAVLDKKQAAFGIAAQQLGQQTGYAKELGALNRDLFDKVTNLGNLVKAQQEFSLRQSASKSYVQQIGPASPPRQVKPNVPLYLALAALAGLLLSIPIAALRDRKEDKVHSMDQAAEIAGVLPVGHIPMLRGVSSATGLVRVDPNIPRFENFRILRSNILFRAAEQNLKTVLVTSTLAGEGKSDLAYNLAVAMAVDSRKVLLIDANFRRPSLYKKLRLEERPGLSEVVNNSEKLATAVHATESENLSVLVAGGAVESPAEFLSGTAMKDFLEAAKKEYDMIIVDAAPVLPNSDTQILSSMVDGVLYVCQLNLSSTGQMRYAVDLLHQAKANLIGLVFNKIEGKQDGSAFKRY